MSTTLGDMKTDKLYFMVIVKYLTSWFICKLDDYLDIIKGVDEIVEGDPYHLPMRE